MKIKHLITGIALSLAMVFGVGAGLINNSGEVKEANASGELGTSDGNLIYACDWDTWNHGWCKETENGTDTHIFAFFHGSQGDCWTSTWINKDIYIYKHDSSENKTYYFVYPSVLNKTYTEVVFVKMKATATAGSWNSNQGYMGQAKTVAIDNTFNTVEMYGNNWSYWDATEQKNKCATGTSITSDISTTTRACGTTLYLRDKHSLSTDAILQAHFWGSSHMCDEAYLNFTQVQGKYDDDDSVVDLWECVVPNHGAYRYFQVKRLKAADTSVVWGTGENEELQSANDVYETSSYSNSIIDGNFIWNITDSTRLNMLSKYIVILTSNDCTPQHESTNTAATFADTWAALFGQDGNGGQYNALNPTVKSSFKTTAAAATDDDNTQPGKGLRRYDYLVWEYNLTDFADRKNGGHFSYASRALAPVLGMDSSNSALIIIVISSIGLISLGGLLIFKKKKQY